MDTILLKFPISTVQYEENYMLAIETDWSQELQDAIIADTAFTAQTVQTPNVLVFEGTLNGDVIISEDKRESIYTPLVTSKLKFSLVTHNFPKWIMEKTYYYTNVRVVLATQIKGQWHERWRGYLWENTLNSTVVDDWITTSIFALDELSMAKYIKIYNTIGEYGRDRRVYNYFNYYKTLNDSNFGTVYTLLGLSTDGHIYLDDEMAFVDNGTERTDLLGELWFNDYMYLYQEENEDKKSWSDLFSDVCNYFGVTFSVGGYGEGAKDAYLLETQDITAFGKDYTRTRYTDDGYTGFTTYSASNYTIITPSEKLNANFNITLEPNKYKGATVKSKAKRYETHEYLTDERNHKLNENKYCILKWGSAEDADTNGADAYLNDTRYRKLYYLEQEPLEERYIQYHTHCKLDEQDNHTYIFNHGYFDSGNTSYSGITTPNNSMADKIGWMNVMHGAVPIKFGEISFRSVTEDESLKNYICLMNNSYFDASWGHFLELSNKWNERYENFCTLWPFTEHQIRHNSEKHYLQIEITANILDENRGNIMYFNSNSSITNTFAGTNAHIFPSITTEYDYNDYGNNLNLKYNTLVDDDYKNSNFDSHEPQLWIQAHIGNDYYLGSGGYFIQNGASVQRPDRYPVSLYSNSIQYTDYVQGGYGMEIKDNTYGELKSLNDPKTDQCRLIDMSNLNSVYLIDLPIEGKLEINILGPMPPFISMDAHHPFLDNNIYTLLHDIKFKFTDDAEIMGKDMKQEETDIFDTLSKTKEVYEVEMNLCSPKYEGQYYNCLTYDNEKQTLNARNWCKQGYHDYSTTAEYYYMERLNSFYAPSPMHLDMAIRYRNTDNYQHSQLVISGITEDDGLFLVREKTFNVTTNQLKITADRVYLNPWRGRGFSHSGSTYGELIQEEENEE